MTHQHTQAPEHPVAGDTLSCACGYAAVYDGQYWVTVMFPPGEDIGEDRG